MQDLENELKSMKPSKPSLVLRRGIEDKVFKENKSVVIPRSVWVRWLPLTAAACLGFFFGRVDPVETMNVLDTEDRIELVQGKEVPNFLENRTETEAVEEENLDWEDLNVQDEGIVYISDDIPARQLRYHFLDSYSWEDPNSRTTYKVSIPRQEVVHVKLTHF